ncbi:hypothetical protein SASPL_153533 [Salvia splendens]|uniref:Tryptophan synthase beta chain-like PALP domain-containing protein n=1 Tax=Salvia splendens TaxID=180675 RepID=A0A8X8YXL2_SALSN|nr:hypothetical protein SASPL_153533 [Salvia splendens]
MQLSGNKVRKLEFLMGEEGADCVITIGGVQSNHCRATAVASNYLNLDCYLILRTTKDLVYRDPGLDGNLLVERLAGARIELVSEEDYYRLGRDELINMLKRKLLSEGRKPYVIPMGGSTSLATWCNIDNIVVACGSGCTGAGLALGSQLAGMQSPHWSGTGGKWIFAGFSLFLEERGVGDGRFLAFAVTNCIAVVGWFISLSFHGV